VQLDLTGVTGRKSLDAQRAIETRAAYFAAEHSTPADHANLRRLLDEAESIIDEPPPTTASCRDFPSRVAEASHNRRADRAALSLQHSHAGREPHAHAAGRAPLLSCIANLSALIEMRDAAVARRLQTTT